MEHLELTSSFDPGSSSRDKGSLTQRNKTSEFNPDVTTAGAPALHFESAYIRTLFVLQAYLQSRPDLLALAFGMAVQEGSVSQRRPITAWKRVWNRTPPGEKLLYWLYAPLLWTVLVVLAIVMSLPFLALRKTRPPLRLGDLPDPDLVPDRSNPPPKSRKKAMYEWYGPQKHYPRGTATVPLGRGPGLHRRLWEMFGTFREIWQMILLQGLQVFGVLSAAILLLMQGQMMYHDFSADVIIKYNDAIAGGASDPDAAMRSDKDCAYAVGTGIANWASGTEPLAWYGAYHGFLCILCICLLGDELLNVRFGCFAPQWFRAGVGYTTIFLASATLSTSPKWGLESSIHFRYYVLVAIGLSGWYNVFRTLISTGLGMSSDGYRHTDYRVGRKPLRLWSESEWNDGYFRQNFIPYAFERYFWTERFQARLGDWNFPLERRTRAAIEEQMEHLETQEPGYDDGRIQKVYQRDAEELKWQKGHANSRIIAHGGPKKMPPDMKRDLEQRKRMHKSPIDPYRLPTDEEEAELIEVLNKDKQYFGIADWKPATKSYGWWWFDVRRVITIVCSVALLGVRIGLCCFDLSPSSMAAYRTEYDQVAAAWRENGGPDETRCQYLKGSSIPILVLPTGGSRTGVLTSMLWLGTWHVFLCGMCVAVLLVAVSNNMYWGMHWPFPCITLIGPRMTSMSMGITLGFVALATLQQGFFFHNDSLIAITKIICYCCMAEAILSLYPNEPFRVNHTRDPFWPWLSRVTYRFLDRKKWHYEFRDTTDE
ncbi:hypothetical protein IAU60_005833 [Kwoniella sp. DSM 27419]